MNMLIFIGEEGEFGLACIPGREFDFQINLKRAIEYAYGLGCHRVHILAGLTSKNFTNDDFTRTYVTNLRIAAEMLEEYCLTGLIEPISPAVKENYFLNSFETAVQILEEVQSPHVKLLLDIYHLKMLTGTVDGLVGYLQYSDYIQVSQAPGRQEPSHKGEINYKDVFNLLEQHYSGHIGLEYKPSGSTTMSLQWPI
ncbi:putative hydroxypyruvate isomerase [Stegodyphus dumicola]|uniref:putative hydroxypyruvate isomerase n=1 Tax=Stegodyphus dumicola TaxID=202533 RepID=UPI0015AE0726|nr:putative hydroxypyruvate isomerase [Stegodyphus dumicola]